MRLARRLHRLLVGLDRHVDALHGRAGGAAAGEVSLTPRELAVLALLADGLTAAAVGRRLLIAERTVHKHLARIYAKLGVHDRLAAVLRAHRIGLLLPRQGFADTAADSAGSNALSPPPSTDAG